MVNELLQDVDYIKWKQALISHLLMKTNKVTFKTCTSTYKLRYNSSTINSFVSVFVEKLHLRLLQKQTALHKLFTGLKKVYVSAGAEVTCHNLNGCGTSSSLVMLVKTLLSEIYSKSVYKNVCFMSIYSE